MVLRRVVYWPHILILAPSAAVGYLVATVVSDRSLAADPPFALGIVGAVLAVLLSLVWYDVTVLILFCMLSISYGGTAGPFDLILPVLAFSGVVTKRIHPAKIWQPRWTALVWICFGLAYLASLFFVSSLPLAVTFVANFFMRFALLLFTKAYVATARGLRIVLSGYAVSAMVSAVLVIASFFGFVSVRGSLFRPDPAGRASGMLGDPNDMGAFFVPIVMILISEILSPTLWRGKVWKVPLLCLCFAGMLLAYSRGTWLNLFAALAMYGVFAMYRSPGAERKRLAMIVVLLGLLSAGLLDVSSRENNLMQRLVYLQPYDIDRFHFQVEGLTLALSRFFGAGPGQSGVVLGYGPHNLFLTVLLENGWGAFLPFIAFVVFLVVKLSGLVAHRDASVSASTRLLANAILASLVGLLVNSMVVDSKTWRVLWFVLALAWAFAANPEVLRRRKSNGAAANAMEFTPG